MGMEDPEERKTAEGWLPVSQKAILAEDMKSWLLRNAMKNPMSFHLKCLKMCVDLPFVVEFTEHGGFLHF